MIHPTKVQANSAKSTFPLPSQSSRGKNDNNDNNDNNENNKIEGIEIDYINICSSFERSNYDDDVVVLTISFHLTSFKNELLLLA
jgi:hypothetical protein